MTKHSPDIAGSSRHSIRSDQGAIPVYEIDFADGLPLTEMLVAVGFAHSKTEAKNLILNRGVRLNDVVVTDPTLVLHA